MFEKLIQSRACIFKLACSDVSSSNFTPNLMLSVRRISRDHLFEALDSVCIPFLLPGDSAQLEVGVNFLIIDLRGTFKPFASRFKLAALLMNQTEVVMRGRIRGIQSC